MKKCKPWPGLVPVGQWLAHRTGIARQTLLSAADTGRLGTAELADGTRCTTYEAVQLYLATHKPRSRRAT